MKWQTDLQGNKLAVGGVRVAGVAVGQHAHSLLGHLILKEIRDEKEVRDRACCLCGGLCSRRACVRMSSAGTAGAVRNT